MNEPQQPDQNPYELTKVANIAKSLTDRQKPGPVAIVFSVILGLVVAVIAFGATFFVTCLGVMSIGWDNAFGVQVSFLVAGLTSVAAFIFTVWGYLKIVLATKS